MFACFFSTTLRSSTWSITASCWEGCSTRAPRSAWLSGSQPSSSAATSVCALVAHCPTKWPYVEAHHKAHCSAHWHSSFSSRTSTPLDRWKTSCLSMTPAAAMRPATIRTITFSWQRITHRAGGTPMTWKLIHLRPRRWFVSFSKSLHLVPLTTSETVIESVKHSKLLGVTLSANLTWNEHIDSTIKKCNQRLYLLLHFRRAGVPPKDLVTLYKAIIRPVLEYAAPVWHSSLPDCLFKDLEQVQRRALRTCFGDGSYNELLNAAGLPTLLDRRVRLGESFYNKMNMSGHKLHHLLPIPRVYQYPLRQPRRLPQLKTRTRRYGNSFVPWAVRIVDWISI